jgi:hypothetical protein
MATSLAVIPGRGTGENPEPMRTDGAGKPVTAESAFGKARVHGFRVQPCGLSRNDGKI